MNYYKASQHQETKKWAFTYVNDGKCFLASCCTDHEGKHETQEEAERCFYDHQILHLRDFELQDSQRKCAVCGAWTSRGLESRMLGDKMLCELHRNKNGFMHAYPFTPGIQGAASWEP